MSKDQGLALSLRNVCVVFGAMPWKAIPLMETGQSRAAILRATGQIMGVHDCSLDVAAGEILVLAGPSEAGKSTLLRTINGLCPSLQGDVLVHDGSAMIRLTKARSDSLRRIRLHHVAMLPQDPGLQPWRSLRQNVALGPELAGKDRRAGAASVDDALEQLGLSQLAAQPITDLPAEMLARVALARTLATGAPVLLLDNPFAALEPPARARLQDAVLTLRRQLQRTIVFSTRDPDEAFRLGDRIAVMDAGRIVQCAPPPQIFTAPATGRVSDFTARVNPLTVLRAIDAAVAPPRPAPAGLTLPSTTPLSEAMLALSRSRAPLLLTEDGRVSGMLTEASALRALNARSLPQNDDTEKQ